MPGLVALPNAARTLSLPARPGGRPSRRGGLAFLALTESVGPRETARKWENGAIKPRISQVFKFDEAPAAHHFIQDRKNIGKVLLAP